MIDFFLTNVQFIVTMQPCITRIQIKLIKYGNSKYSNSLTYIYGQTKKGSFLLLSYNLFSLLPNIHQNIICSYDIFTTRCLNSSDEPYALGLRSSLHMYVYVRVDVNFYLIILVHVYLKKEVCGICVKMKMKICANFIIKTT